MRNKSNRMACIVLLLAATASFGCSCYRACDTEATHASGEEIVRLMFQFVIENHRMPSSFAELGFPPTPLPPNGPWTYMVSLNYLSSFITAADYDWNGWEIYRDFRGSWRIDFESFSTQERHEVFEIWGKALSYYLANGHYPENVSDLGLGDSWGALGPWTLERVTIQNRMNPAYRLQFISKGQVVFVFEDLGWWLDT